MILARSSLQIASILVLFCAMISDLRADDLEVTAATPVEHVDPFISTGGNRYVCGNNPPGGHDAARTGEAWSRHDLRRWNDGP